MKTQNKVNPASSELTYEKLKSYSGYENISEAEAEQHIKAIKAFAKILFYLSAHEPENENEANENNNNTENK